MIKPLILYNTLTRKKENFKPIDPSNVGMYTCGPTVYDYAHIGHMRKYVGDDILKRVLQTNAFTVKHVMNITDVGHLTSDADEGEDKLEKGARKAGKTVWEVARFFELQFFQSTDAMNILRPDIVSRATEHIEEQINIAIMLQEKGFTYVTDEGVYFDISKFPSYTDLSGQKIDQKRTAAREDVNVDPDKKHPADFAVWLFTKGRFADHVMHWPSPWGEGFPGWHIECSAMSMKYLGETIDIHTGGIDHIPVHHTNEIAQSEAATGKKFVNYWLHYNFLQVDGQKMSKSLENIYTVEDVKTKGYDPIALRYLFLTAHYRDKLNFTWNALEGAQNALNNLKSSLSKMIEKKENERTKLSDEKLEKIDVFNERFRNALSDDLNTPQAMAVLWEMLKSNIPTPDKVDMLYSFDEILGLGLREVKAESARETPQEVQELMKYRVELRAQGRFEEADKIRAEIEKKGFSVIDPKLNA